MQVIQPLSSLTHRFSERIGVIRWKIWKSQVLQARAKRRLRVARNPNATPRLNRMYAWRQSKAATGGVKRIAASLGLLALLIPGLLAARPAQAQQLNYTAGSLIRGQSFSAVYYLGADGLRYVFPDEKTYFTWYNDFSTVQFISDAELGKIQIGGNATYKPGSKLLKINSDPRTYAVDQGGVLRWVTSEEIAVSLYGATWNTAQTNDVPDAFFSNYTIGEPIMSTGDYSATEARASSANINEDKSLRAYTTVVISDDDVYVENDGSSEAEIGEGDTVLFYNGGAAKHSATADDGTWGTGTLNPDDFYVRKFTERGTYDFYDSYDDSLTGTIVVN